MPVAGDVRNQLLEVADFKSINKKVREDRLDLNIGTIAQNLRYDGDVGEITKRFNRALYGNMSTLGTSKVIHGDRYYNTSGGTEEQIIAYSTFIKVGDDSDGSFTNLFTSLTADVHKRSLTYKDVWYFCDLTNTSGAYDGTNTEDMGVPTPSSAPTVATGAAGVLTGNYQYKVTFEIDGYQEGNASAASGVVAPSSEKVELTSQGKNFWFSYSQR